MKRCHRMPFGCQARGEGITFRLWAPSIDQLRLRVEGPEPREYPMSRAPDGWHGVIVTDAGPGTRYRFRLPNGLLVPDPASRFNPYDVHGPSEVMDPCAFDWPDTTWHGRPWEEAVIYELHVGAFTPEGTFAGVQARLDYLRELGVTALEIMPVAAFPGRWNWGYDGVLPYAPDATYGRPDDFKRLIAAAHHQGLMIILDVVYNHFGPDGNYLHTYAPEFFNTAHHTPWGAAINFDRGGSRTVRDFFLHNALYWLEEFHLDGLRLDAVHAICDDSVPDIVEEIGTAVRNGPGRTRTIHLILENDRNQARYLRRDPLGQPLHATAQWNDDTHHALHVIATSESDGYFLDYADDAHELLARCLTEGFAFQGESSHFRGGEPRGEPSADLTPLAFVDFLQTHDQVGNRAFGERLCHLTRSEVLEALTVLLLLAPHPPLLFMGEEFAAAQPFLFFCDFGADLAAAVTTGRRREFARFARYADSAARARIPDPNAPDTFGSCILDWSAPLRSPHRAVLDLYRRLLSVRQREIVPRLSRMSGGTTRLLRPMPRMLCVSWELGDRSQLHLQANLGPDEVEWPPSGPGALLFTSSNITATVMARDTLPAWSVVWRLETRDGP